MNESAYVTDPFLAQFSTNFNSHITDINTNISSFVSFISRLFGSVDGYLNYFLIILMLMGAILLAVRIIKSIKY